ncbi:MAG TPA: HD domain-containing protein, partial [bacterium]|nr:HD domain-containing protein [bacterium]
MDLKLFQHIVKRSPHFDILRIIRPTDIIRAVMETHPSLTDEERMRAREKINKAIVLATAAHQGVLRESGEPYITHPYAVAYVLAKMGMTVECVIAGFLHDTVEDATTTIEEIRQMFGDAVANLVDGVTKLSLANIGKEEKKAQAFQKLFVYAARDGIGILFVKLADRLQNMMTLDAVSPEKQQRVARETLQLYAPLAHRLGVYWMKEELESLSFYYCYPEEWKQIDDYITTRFQQDPAKALETLQKKVRAVIVEHCPPVAGKIEKVYGRIKSYPSIYRKTIKQNKTIGSLHDIVGIRVILDSPNRDDCYLAMAAIHSFPEFTVMNDRFKDYIARPKANDYQSIHTVVRYHEYSMEVQIRTRGMHRIAEEGDASHWAYKNEIAGNDKAMLWLKKVLGDLPDVTANPMDFVHDIATAIPLEKISVFTPKGDLITLPEGATVLDFAYAIHGDLGDTCVGGTVNGRKVPIYYCLSNKDEVAIETSKKQFPRHDWLTFVATHKAKTYI